MAKSHTIDQLPLQNRQALQRIFDGTDLPPLYSDIIAKSVFNADVHPDRLNFLQFSHGAVLYHISTTTH